VRKAAPPVDLFDVNSIWADQGVAAQEEQSPKPKKEVVGVEPVEQGKQAEYSAQTNGEMLAKAYAQSDLIEAYAKIFENRKDDIGDSVIKLTVEQLPGEGKSSGRLLLTEEDVQRVSAVGFLLLIWFSSARDLVRLRKSGSRRTPPGLPTSSSRRWPALSTQLGCSTSALSVAPGPSSA